MINKKIKIPQYKKVVFFPAYYCNCKYQQVDLCVLHVNMGKYYGESAEVELTI